MLLHYKLKMVTPAQGTVFCFFFFNFEWSSAAKNYIFTMQPSCSHLNLPVIIALIMFTACRLMVTVLSLDGFFRQKWGSHFTYISPEAFIFTVPWVLPKSENDTNFSDLGPAHAVCAVEYSHVCVHVVTHLCTTGDSYTTAPQ